MAIKGTDKSTGKVLFQAPVGTKKEQVELEYISIPSPMMQQLRDLATEDGFVPDAETEKGKSIQRNNAAKAYVRLAVERLLEFRAKGEETEETTEE